MSVGPGAQRYVRPANRAGGHATGQAVNQRSQAMSLAFLLSVLPRCALSEASE
jgi:hypothetical protein